MILVVHLFDLATGKPLGDGKPFAHKVSLVHVQIVDQLIFFVASILFRPECVNNTLRIEYVAPLNLQFDFLADSWSQLLLQRLLVC